MPQTRENKVKNIPECVKRTLQEVFAMTDYSYSGNEDQNLWVNHRLFLMFKGTDLKEPNFGAAMYQFLPNEGLEKVKNNTKRRREHMMTNLN